MMADHDHVTVIADDTDGIFHLFGFNLGRKCAGLLGRKYSSAQAKHGSFKRKASASGGLIEQRRQNAVLTVEGAPAGDHAFHATRAVKQFHQKRNGELLRLKYMPEPGLALLIGKFRAVG